MRVMPAWVGPSAAQFVTPKGDRWPEGQSDLAIRVERIVSEQPGTILDFGCGDGRLAHLFPFNRYIGWDQNPDLVRMAAKANPLYPFATSTDGGLPEYSASLACMVFNHVPDADIAEWIETLCSGDRPLYLIEVLDPAYRLMPNPTQGNFHRSAETYDRLAPDGMSFSELDQWEASRRKCVVTLGRFSKWVT
jgi:SAM-dependent methyltransferase